MADLFRNTRGGLSTGSALLADAGLVVDLRSAGLPGEAGQLFAYVLWNNDTVFSERYVGDFQVVSKIDAPRELRMYEFWYQQALSQAATLRVGLYDLNSEFDAMEAAGLFLNSSQGIGAEYAQSGRNGPSIFPVTSLAARLEYRFGRESVLRYALLDGVPGDSDDLIESAVELGGEDGVLNALEYEASLSEKLRFTIGGWLYSADFERVDGSGPPEDGNAGVYTSLEWTAVRHGRDGPEVDVYFRYGLANESLNPVRSYFGAGVVASGLNVYRSRDKFGLSVASVQFGDPYRRAAGAESHETVVELTYRAPLNDWITVQPDVQYVRNPGGNPQLGDSLVVGLRILVRGSHRF